jgi:hypothetical protein
MLINREKKVAFLIFGIVLFLEGVALCGEEVDKESLAKEKKYVMEWRKDRDEFLDPPTIPSDPRRKEAFKD